MSKIKLCKACGEEFPRTHVVYIDKADGYYCDCCISEVMEDDE